MFCKCKNCKNYVRQINKHSCTLHKERVIFGRLEETIKEDCTDLDPINPIKNDKPWIQKVKL